MALSDLFELYVPERALRSGDDLRVKTPMCNTAFGQRNLTYRGGLYWNSLPVSIKASESADSFKLALKNYPGFD